MEPTLGKMEEDMKERGKVIKWKAKAFSRGVMAGGMMENMWMIKNKASAPSIGQMEENIKENGLMGNKMAKAPIQMLEV